MPAPATDPAFRILVVVSRPLDQPDLPHIGDQWALINGLRSVKAPVYLKILRPPTIEDLRTEILAGYEILHFDGHGSFGLRCHNCSMLHEKNKKKCDRCSASLEDQGEGGYLAFERQDGALDSLSAQDLAEIVAFPGSPTKLVILSACESAAGDQKSILQTLIDKGVPAVIGMKETISAGATEALFSPFYAALGARMSLSDALKTARPSLRRFDDSGKAVSSIPQLEGKGKDAKLVESRRTGNTVYEQELLYGVPQYKFVGDYIRGDPPRGRKGYVARLIHAFLDNEKMAVLTGQGGIGKTVLAAETAKRLAWRFPGGVFWRSAADVEHLGLSELLDAFVAVFGEGFRQQTTEAKRDQVLGYLGRLDKGSLIVVDNAERIEDEHLWRFLDGIPQPSAVLVTIRESLAYGGQEIHIDEMEEGESIKLFTLEAAGKSPRWDRVLNGKEKLSSLELKDLVEIWRLLQGHPLGLKVAAGMLSSHSLPSIRESLRAHPPTKVSERFDFSFELELTDSEKELLKRIAVFAGSFSLEAVQAVCATEGQSLDCSESLGELVRKSFVEKMDDAASRYRLHPLMRQYVAGKAGSKKVEEYHRKAAMFYLDVSIKYKSDFDVMELERENILSGMDWAFEKMRSSDDAKDVAKIVSAFMSALNDYLFVRGYWDLYRIRLNQTIEAETLLEDKDSLIKWTYILGVLAQETGNYDEAQMLIQQSLEIAQKLDNKSLIAWGFHYLGILADYKGNYDEARMYHQQSLKIFEELCDENGMSVALGELGNLAYATGNYDEARIFYKRGLKIFEKLGNSDGIAGCLHQMGILALDTGNYNESKMQIHRSLKILEERGDQSGISRSLHQLGTLAQQVGNCNEARILFQQSLDIKKKIGDQSGYAISLAQLATLEEKAGNIPKAIELTQQAESIFAKIGSHYAEKARKQRERLEEEKNKSS